MKRIIGLLLVIFLAICASCGSNKKAAEATGELEEILEEKNRVNISLLTRIRRLPGVVLKNGLPAITKNVNTMSPFGTGEPLYVVNGQIIGNSFKSIDQLLDSYNVKTVKVLSDSEATFYGSRAASGVIAITTIK